MYLRVSPTGAIKFPYTLGDLRNEHPAVSFPNQLIAMSEFGVVEVQPAPVPVFDSATHRVRHVTPQLVGDQYVETWEVLQLPLEQAQANVRSLRDQKLVACDWTQIADAPVDQTAWAVYRQALRDIPAQAEFPYSVTWPTSP
jgi:hypothetical protein